MTAPVATTPFGRVRGLRQTVRHHGPAPVDIAIFKGIPYATAERFEKPVAVTSLDTESTQSSTRRSTPRRTVPCVRRCSAAWNGCWAAAACRRPSSVTT